MLKYWKSLLWAIIILVLLLLPGDKISQHKLFQIKHLDKVVHLFLFGVLQFLVLVEGGIYPRASRAGMLVLLYCILFAIASELLQFIPFTGRDPTVYDFLADLAGLLCGGLILRIAYKLKFLSYHPRY